MNNKGILRKRQVIDLTKLSSSSIDAKNRKESRYYDPDFPQRFPLTPGGRAVGWKEKEVLDWIERRAATAGVASPSVPRVKKGRVGRPRKTTATTGVLSNSPLPKSKRKPVAKSLGEAVIEGSDLVAHIAHYLKLQFWTPAMGFLLAQGIAPPEGALDIASLTDLKGLDDKAISTSDLRIGRARRLLEQWVEWAETEEEVPEVLTPTDFLVWCWDGDMETPWLKLINQVNGSGEEQDDPIRQAQLALMISR